MTSNTSITSVDELYYNKAKDYINENKLDKAWSYINKIQSITLKNSFYQFSNKSQSDKQDKIKYTGYYKGCDGDYHSYDDGGYSPSSPPSGNDNGGDDCCDAICGGIFIIGCTICCSASIDGCCWCALCDLIGDCIECCS